mmetsp:Transcript_25792/g.48935  ORF Transcript_25792/g.48935 Transcript_25792/m.48935 type:complete len:404 (-) Transcript_25792:502-1713(-)|eukprot:CAMPEP_0114258332 /NCGR_PEP_ID=MMETSP0058-20121206/19272_1 /TAXON_ID=36894 /ORGANISM="Pyramimonas parkeae, CCMP726" /LENGTH=403 /DNA_ID=CAMNT_0001373243 /DNA_START=67 /DNA_END=1278 /DNA_ORIENTATION=-
MTVFRTISAASFYGGDLPRPFVMQASNIRVDANDLQYKEGREAGYVEEYVESLPETHALRQAAVVGVLRNNKVLLDFANKVSWSSGGRSARRAGVKKQVGETTPAQREKLCNFSKNKNFKFTPSGALTFAVAKKTKRDVRRQTKRNDPRKPAHALSAFQYWMQDQRTKANDAGLKKLTMAEMAKQWSELSVSMKQAFNQMHEAEHARFVEANAAYRALLKQEKSQSRRKKEEKAKEMNAALATTFEAKQRGAKRAKPAKRRTGVAALVLDEAEEEYNSASDDDFDAGSEESEAESGDEYESDASEGEEEDSDNSEDENEMEQEQLPADSCSPRVSRASTRARQPLTPTKREATKSTNKRKNDAITVVASKRPRAATSLALPSPIKTTEASQKTQRVTRARNSM